MTRSYILNIEKSKYIYEEYKDRLQHNRKNAIEVMKYVIIYLIRNIN
ncbi:hypothetical protein [Clostridium sp. LP20]